MLQPLPAHLPIAPPQSFGLAITQLEHLRGIAQLQLPTADPSHDFHPLQLTTAHGCPLQRDLLWAGGLSLRGHFYRVREGTLSKSFNSRGRSRGFCVVGSRILRGWVAIFRGDMGRGFCVPGMGNPRGSALNEVETSLLGVREACTDGYLRHFVGGSRYT